MTTSPIVLVVAMVNYWVPVMGRENRRRNLGCIMGIDLGQVTSTTCLTTTSNPSLMKLMPIISSAREKMRTYSMVMVIITGDAMGETI
jgi:hypothetical protein